MIRIKLDTTIQEREQRPVFGAQIITATLRGALVNYIACFMALIFKQSRCQVDASTAVWKIKLKFCFTRYEQEDELEEEYEKDNMFVMEWYSQCLSKTNMNCRLWPRCEPVDTMSWFGIAARNAKTSIGNLKSFSSWIACESQRAQCRGQH